MKILDRFKRLLKGDYPEYITSKHPTVYNDHLSVDTAMAEKWFPDNHTEVEEETYTILGNLYTRKIFVPHPHQVKVVFSLSGYRRYTEVITIKNWVTPSVTLPNRDGFRLLWDTIGLNGTDYGFEVQGPEIPTIEEIYIFQSSPEDELIRAWWMVWKKPLEGMTDENFSS